MESPDLPTSIGFIGLGLMGLPMAHNLAAKMSPDSILYIYDISSTQLDTFTSNVSSPARVTRCTSPGEVASKATTILTMLPEGPHVHTVYLDPETGILTTLPTSTPTFLLDMSTIDTATSALITDTLSSTHPLASFHDAPVSGGVLGAQKAALTFMLGISPTASHYRLVKSVLETMGTNIFPCGSPTLGLVAKLCNNYCSGLIAIATSEAFSIAIAAGMDPRILKEIFSKSLAQSVINDKWNPIPGLCPEAPASRGYQGGFRVGLMRKDFGLAREMGGRLGVGLRLGEVGMGVYVGAEGDEACKGLDSRVVFRYLGGDERWRGRFPDVGEGGGVVDGGVD